VPGQRDPGLGRGQRDLAGEPTDQSTDLVRTRPQRAEPNAAPPQPAIAGAEPDTTLRIARIDRDHQPRPGQRLLQQ
jgi:hypothetical protein